MIYVTNQNFEAVNNTCTGIESRIIFVLMAYPKISTKDAVRMTGVSQSNHYFQSRKNLIDKGYIFKDGTEWQIDMDKILSDYAGEKITC